jgi:hypothetical protein
MYRERQSMAIARIFMPFPCFVVPISNLLPWPCERRIDEAFLFIERVFVAKLDPPRRILLLRDYPNDRTGA